MDHTQLNQRWRYHR